MRVEKNGVQYDIKNKVQLSTFLSSGWKEVGEQEELPENPVGLNTLTKEQLIELAKQKGVDISGVKNEKQLIKLLENA